VPISSRSARVSSVFTPPTFSSTRAGTVSIICSEYAADAVLSPKLDRPYATILTSKVEIFIEHSFSDIAADWFDAGVRLGESLEKDMVPVRIAADGWVIAVASPAYLASRPAPDTPQDLVAHTCIKLRLATRGGVYPWEFKKGDHPVNVRVEGS